MLFLPSCSFFLCVCFFCTCFLFFIFCYAYALIPHFLSCCDLNSTQGYLLATFMTTHDSNHSSLHAPPSSPSSSPFLSSSCSSLFSSSSSRYCSSSSLVPLFFVSLLPLLSPTSSASYPPSPHILYTLSSPTTLTGKIYCSCYRYTQQSQRFMKLNCWIFEPI